MSIEPFMGPSSVVVSCDECGRRRPEHAPACSRFAGVSGPGVETDVDRAAFDAERERLAAPLDGVDSIAHRVTLRVLAERPNDPQIQQQWAGRLQGMAMAGLVWRLADGPWKLTSHARALLAADTSTPPPDGPEPSGDYLPLEEMLDLLAEAKDRRDHLGARLARPGSPTLTSPPSGATPRSPSGGSSTRSTSTSPIQPRTGLHPPRCLPPIPTPS